MKKAIFIFIFSALVFSSFSQPGNSSAALTKQDYLKKSKNQKITAWVLLGGGTITWLAGASKNMNQNDNVDGGGEVAMIVGGLAALSSIPFFIIASKNKKKAAAISFRMEKVQAVLQQNLVYHLYPALSLNIALQ